mgnify:CR=1 FL=1
MCFDARISPVIPSWATSIHHWVREPFFQKNVASRMRTEEEYFERLGLSRSFIFRSISFLNSIVNRLWIVRIDTLLSFDNSARVCLRTEYLWNNSSFFTSDLQDLIFPRNICPHSMHLYFWTHLSIPFFLRWETLHFGHILVIETK